MAPPFLITLDALASKTMYRASQKALENAGRH